MRIVLACLIGLSLLAGRARAGGSEEYARTIKPLLAAQCVSCHGVERPKAGLRLDTAAAAIRGGRGGPAVVPGKADESPLYLAVIGEGDVDRMPLKRPPLPTEQVEALRAWIDSGAEAPAGEIASIPPRHWAFLSPQRPSPPTVRNRAWVRNPIDGFILEPLERDGIAPSAEADKVTLIRRVHLDLIGLPPSLAEVDAALADDRPDAYERLVDRLLASPHFGERWARPWLDLARYADSNGYSIDAPRSIWKYRDWVIDALNRDMPFDRFAIEQLAGDLLPDASIDQKVATGFHRNTPINQEGGIDPEQFRIESVIDRVNTTGTAFLGLTVGCCQCHDHKYDPLSQREYFQFFAFFNNSDEPDLKLATPEEQARQDQVEARIREYLDEIRTGDAQLVEAQRSWEAGLDMAGRQRQSEAFREAMNIPFEKRDEAQRKVAFEAFVEQSPSAKAPRQAIAAMRRSAPKAITSMVVRERSRPRDTRLFIKGDFTRLGDPVGPGVPKVLPPLGSSASPPNRLDLAHWLVDPKHPLTARVAVNRIWQAYFGRGLVETENDFGTQGSSPTHPELLDWLASEFADRGWGVKSIHRLIVTSTAYRQSSIVRPDLARVDPENRRLARQSRLRLEAELIRDSALSASGLLTPVVGGPSVFPPQPDGVMSLGQVRRDWAASAGPDRFRRGLYTYFWRATPHPALVVFDAPDATRACTRRMRSNTPLQALTLLNDHAYFELAQALADRVLREGPADDEGRLAFAFRLGLARTPAVGEIRRLSALLADARRSDPDRESWTTLARVLLNLDEFITRE
jgi:mono/diheme cytochrome c family protein